MSNEHKTIHDFDFDLICEYFKGMERQGPGSVGATLRALSFVEGPLRRIADLGCGTGGQTMTLALNTDADITGVDLFPDFIDMFDASARRLGVEDRVRGVVGSMHALPFGDGELDLIWCEGAIYNIGFELGLREWRRFLRTGGYVAVTENTWFTDERPAEIEAFWNAAYPEIDTIPEKIAAMQRAGYEFVAAFALPSTLWTEFYALQIPLREEFMRRHKGNRAVEEYMASERDEAALYEKYGDHYGYVFYIGRKP